MVRKSLRRVRVYLIFLAGCQSDEELQRLCNVQTNCRECIRASPKCSWCLQFRSVSSSFSVLIFTIAMLIIPDMHKYTESAL